MKKKLLTIILAATAASHAAADNTVEGLTYFLPKTAVRMSVLVEKTTFKPGELADYSEIYFKTSAATEPSTSYRIVGVTFTPVGLPDETKRYTVAIDKKHSIISVDCDRNGVIKAINDKVADTALPKPFKAARKAVQLDPRDFMNQDMLTAGNMHKMAQLVAQEIYDIRDSRNQLARGEADNMPNDGAQLKMMFSELKKQETALTQMFVGTADRDTVENIVTIVPQKDQARQVAFRFSRAFGFAAADDYSGAPYYITVADENVIADMPEEANTPKKDKDDFQLAMNLPGKIKLTLSDGNNEVASFETWAAQFGRTETISGALFGKKITSHVTFDPVTGAVLKLRTEPLE